jgi:hypothetical protein
MKPNRLPVFLRALRVSAFRSNRETIANDSAAAREAAVANAWTPEDGHEQDSDGWFKVSPYGVFPGLRPGRPQYFGEPQARLIVGEFNSVLGRLGRLFRGVPIYRGHPDVDPTIWQDDRRLGKIAALQARPDGLWAQAEWNSLGQENQREGYWIYPSPRWDAPVGGNRFEPDRLISVGLTNTPRIPGSEPAVHNSIETEDSETEDSRQETEQTTTMDPKIIREKLGLPPEATDEEVFAKIDSLTAAGVAAAQAEADKAAAEANANTATAAAADATRKKDEMACSLTAARKQANGAIIDLALVRGSITAAEKPAWEAKLGDDATREAAVNSIGQLQQRFNTRALQGGQGRAEREQAGSMREQVANAVEALEAKGMSYTEAWCAVKKRPEFSGYFG